MWKYCPLCGEKLKNPSSQKHGNCPNCKQNWYKDSRPTASILIYKTEKPSKLLFAKRAIEPKKGELDLIGGFVNLNETPLEAIRREAKEELNIQIKDLTFLSQQTSKYKYQQLTYSCLDTTFVAPLGNSQKPTPNDDVAELVWLDVQSSTPSLAFSSLENTVDIYRKKYLPSTRTSRA